MSEYTFLYINHSCLKLTACFLFLAIIVTKQCWYCSQKLHSYTLSFLHTPFSHNYTKLNVRIWLWCVAKDGSWLSNSTLTVISILLYSMTEHVLGPYWWGCTASAFSQSWSSMTQSLYLIWSIMEINMWFIFVCMKNWSKFGSEYLKEQGLLGRTKHSWEYNIKMDLKEGGWKGVVDWIHSAQNSC